MVHLWCLQQNQANLFSFFTLQLQVVCLIYPMSGTWSSITMSCSWRCCWARWHCFSTLCLTFCRNCWPHSRCNSNGSEVRDCNCGSVRVKRFSYTWCIHITWWHRNKEESIYIYIKFTISSYMPVKSAQEIKIYKNKIHEMNWKIHLERVK